MGTEFFSERKALKELRDQKIKYVDKLAEQAFEKHIEEYKLKAKELNLNKEETEKFLKKLKESAIKVVEDKFLETVKEVADSNGVNMKGVI